MENIVDEIKKHKNVWSFKDRQSHYIIKINFWKGSPTKSVYIPFKLNNKKTVIKSLNNNNYLKIK